MGIAQIDVRLGGANQDSGHAQRICLQGNGQTRGAAGIEGVGVEAPAQQILYGARIVALDGGKKVLERACSCCRHHEQRAQTDHTAPP